MNKFNIFLGLVFSLSILFSSDVIAQELIDSFVVTEDVFLVRDNIEANGGILFHIFPEEGILIGKLPDDVNIKGIEIYDLNSRFDNNLFYAWKKSFEVSEEKLVVDPIYDDLIIEDVDIDLLNYIPESLPQESLPTDTSLYMIGDISVSVILPESISGSEDWDNEEIMKVYSEVISALGWYVEREPNAHLTFIYNFEERVPVTSEPISYNLGYMSYWINEIMDELDFGVSGDIIPATSLVYDYVNYQRDLKNADWGFAIFIVDSSNDADGKFSDGSYAFSIGSSSGGGPFLVMTYDNAEYGIDNMGAVLAHETGHIFGAADQYGFCSSSIKRGYLYYENQNCVNGGLIDETSIMKNALDAFEYGLIDVYARGQIGWADSDLDNILDILDVEHNIEINSCEEFRGKITCYGDASLETFETLNPLYNSVSINKIDSVLYRTFNLGRVSNWFDINHFSNGFKFSIPLKNRLDVMLVDRFGVETDEENYGHLSLEVITPNIRENGFYEMISI
jgi:hypothetical protein